MPELSEMLAGGASPGGVTGGLQNNPQGAPGMPATGDISLQETVEVSPSLLTAKEIEEIREDEKNFEIDVQYKLSPEEKALITERVIQYVDQCERDRAGWKEIRKDSLDMLNGVRPPKSDPFPGCSNITCAAIPTHCKMMHAKLFPAVWNEDTVNWRPIEKGDVDNVDKVKKFMSWVVRQDLKLQPKIDDILWDLVVNGTVALKTRWETKYRTISEKNADGKLEYKEVAHQYCQVDNVTIDEVYLPKLWEGVDDSEFIAQDIYMRLPELEDLADRKIYPVEDIEGKLSPTLDQHVPDSLKQQKKETAGIASSAIESFKGSIPIRLIECYMKWILTDPVTGLKKPTESVFTIAYESKTYLSGKPLSAVSPIGKRPWAIGQFIRRTGLPYGVSLAEWMRGLSKELDAIHNQRIDSGTITISPFGFYRAASSFKPAVVQLGPGVMIPVDDIKDVYFPPLPHNLNTSFQEERIVIEYIEKLTATSSYQMGRESDVVKSRATATGTMAIIGQGEQSFTILGMRCQTLVTDLLTNILQQYQMWMPDGYADRVLGEDGGDLFGEGLSREDIYGQMDAYMTLDATAGNKGMERQANQVMVQKAPNLIALAQDPRGYEIVREFLLGIGKVDVEKYIGKKPAGKPQGLLPPQPGGEGAGNQEGQPGGGGGAPQQ